MRYLVVVTLSLALSSASVTSAPYTRGDCEFIEQLLGNCAGLEENSSPDCEPFTTIREASDYRNLAYKHPELKQQFKALCSQVCYAETTTAAALRKFCPRQPRKS